MLHLMEWEPPSHTVGFTQCCWVFSVLTSINLLDLIVITTFEEKKKFKKKDLGLPNSHLIRLKTKS